MPSTKAPLGLLLAMTVVFLLIVWLLIDGHYEVLLLLLVVAAVCFFAHYSEGRQAKHKAARKRLVETFQESQPEIVGEFMRAACDPDYARKYAYTFTTSDWNRLAERWLAETGRGDPRRDARWLAAAARNAYSLERTGHFYHELRPVEFVAPDLGNLPRKMQERRANPKGRKPS